jgi:hypothetical protein
LLVVSVVVEKRAFIVDRARGHLHPQCMLFSRLLDLFQMFVVTVLR